MADPDRDAELLAALAKGKYVRPERRASAEGKLRATLKAELQQVPKRTQLALEAPAPKTQAIIAELGPEPSEQALDAWAARLDGAPLIDVAHDLGVSIATARKLLNEVHEALKEDLKTNLEFNRSLDLGRIDALLKSYFPDAKAGNVDAARLVLKCLQQRAELTGSAAKASASPTGPQNVLVWIQNQLPNINRLVDSLPLP